MITVKSFEFNFFQENTYLVYDETGEAVLIDCGCYRKDEEKELSTFISDNKLTLKHLLCTHLHLDHIFGNPFILRTYGLTPEAHRLDVEQLPTPTEQAKSFGMTGRIETVPIGNYLVGNQVIKFGKSELLIITVPGHSPGGLAFYNKKNGIVVVGDTLFSGSIGRTDIWNGNHEVLTAAIRDKLFVLPEETIVYPGHGPETRIIDEKLNNPYL